jgi:elongation factor P--beta-lysine ligase
MTFQVQQAEQLSIEQMEEFLQGSRQMEFKLEGRAEVYRLIERVLSHCHYSKLGKRERGVVRAYLIKLTALSRAQTTRLIGRWNRSREVRPLPARRPSFSRRYRPCDVALLARVDAAHEDLSGPAIRRILQREYGVYHKPEFERLAGLSVSHLYNLMPLSFARHR